MEKSWTSNLWFRDPLSVIHHEQTVNSVFCDLHCVMNDRLFYVERIHFKALNLTKTMINELEHRGRKQKHVLIYIMCRRTAEASRAQALPTSEHQTNRNKIKSMGFHTLLLQSVGTDSKGRERILFIHVSKCQTHQPIKLFSPYGVGVIYRKRHPPSLLAARTAGPCTLDLRVFM